MLLRGQSDEYFKWRKNPGHWSPTGFVDVEDQGTMPWEKYGMSGDEPAGKPGEGKGDKAKKADDDVGILLPVLLEKVKENVVKVNEGVEPEPKERHEPGPERGEPKGDQFFTWDADHWSPNGYVQGVVSESTVPVVDVPVGDLADVTGTSFLGDAFTAVKWAALGFGVGVALTIWLARRGVVPPALVKAQA